MTTQTPADMARTAAEKLTGTCQGIANLGPEYEDLETNAEFCAVLDSLVFCCTCCDWWCEQSEMAETDTDEWICTECAESI